MHNRNGLTTLVVLIALAGLWQPLGAQSRQDRVAAEQARTSDDGVQACSVLTNSEIRQVTGRNERWVLNDEPYGKGSLCDYSGVVTLRIFSGKKPEADVDWTLQNYQKAGDTRHPISGFGTGAFVLFPTPRDQYEDTGAVLVGRAGARMFMLSLTAPDGKSAESVQPQLLTLAKMVVERLR